MSSSQNSPVFLFIVGCSRSPPVFTTLRKLVCSPPWLCRSKTPCESKCLLQVPVLPQTARVPVSLSVCLSVRISVCRTALLYDPAHFPLTFHFLYSHPVSGTTALCCSAGVQYASCCLVLCRGCAHNFQFC